MDGAGLFVGVVCGWMGGVWGLQVGDGWLMSSLHVNATYFKISQTAGDTCSSIIEEGLCTDYNPLGV